MNAKLKDVLTRVERWPEAAQQQLAEIALEIDLEIAQDVYDPTPQELQAIDEAREAVRRGEIATNSQVEAVFAKHRRV